MFDIGAVTKPFGKKCLIYIRYLPEALISGDVPKRLTTIFSKHFDIYKQNFLSIIIFKRCKCIRKKNNCVNVSNAIE